MTEELEKSQGQIKNLQQNVTEISRSFENYQLQNNNQASYMQPIIEKLQKIFKETDSYTKFMNQFEASKNKLIKIGNFKVDNYGANYAGEAVRDINIAAQRCKLQILNKSKISQEEKTAIV